jgi:uroporphyrinogen III methyltransferase/synthase
VSVVYLIGAGPGDPKLLSVRGRECLAAADVVVFDHLVHPRLLGHARAGAEKIDVGTASQRLEQDAICYLLAEKAREGKIVARLKEGDPFVFDRGGAEALFLHEQRVPFEVVPGIPTVIGSSIYAGIPLTYPGAGDTLTFVRGHDGPAGAPMDVPWESIARLDGTLVCHAGPDQVPEMLAALLAHGRSPDESAALIYDGTLPHQETVLGSIEELASRIGQSNDRRPAILIVGRVAALRQHLRWFDARPLFGKRVLVTRSREQAAELVDLLESLGAEAIEAPMIRIAPPDDYGPLDDACARTAEFDWIVFSSANAVESFFGRLLASPLDVRALGGVKLCAVGPATAAQLARYSLKVDLVPAEYRAEAFADALAATGPMRGLRILIPRADIGREVVAEELRRRGAEVTEVVAYRTVMVDPERDGGPDIYRMLLEKQIDIVTFTSASAVRNLVRVLGAEPAPDLLRTTIVACIGPVTADAAAQCGIGTSVMPADYTTRALVNAIVAHVAQEATAS